MTLLLERAKLSGRLCHIHDETGAQDFLAPQIGHVRLLTVPEDQDLETELDFLTSHLPTHVAALAGEYPDGAPWMLVVERVPEEPAGGVGDFAPVCGQPALDQLFTRAQALNPGLRQRKSWVIDPVELRKYYAWACEDPSAPGDLSFCDQLRGLVAEVCGYPLADLVANRGRDCAFGDHPHECQHDLFADIFQGWIDGVI